MVELFVKFKHRIDWVDYDTWNGYTSSNITITEDVDNEISCFWNGWGTTTISKQLLNKNSKYRVKFRVTKKGKSIEGDVKIICGDDEIIQTLVYGETYDFVMETGNSKIFGFRSMNSSDKFGLTDISIEDINFDKLNINQKQLSLNYSINKIEDFSVRSGNYSKTLTLLILLVLT